MGRRSRHSAKTGDQSLYKSRGKQDNNSDDNDDNDDDPMYNEVERYHNNRLREEENYLKLDDASDDNDEDGSSSDDEDDGITTKQEGIFNLAVNDDDDGDSSSEEEDEEEEEKKKIITSKQQESDDSDSSSSDDDEEDFNNNNNNKSSSKLFNWGQKKHSYYHGDTADLEIGQDVDDAYLEEEAGREVELARLNDMEDGDFMLDDDSDDDDDDDNDRDEGDDGGEECTGSNKKRTTIIQSKRKQQQQTNNISKLSKKDKLKAIKSSHPELIPLLQHFKHPIEELCNVTMNASGALLKGGVKKCRKEAEAVGATPAGIQYLITKSMLQASKALNVSLYLLLKADQAAASSSKKSSVGDTTDTISTLLMEDDEDTSDDIRNHPVMDRLNQLSQLTDKLQEGVEDKVPMLKEQMNSLVKAAALMADGELSDSDSDEEDDDSEGSVASGTQEEDDNEEKSDADTPEEQLDDEESSSSESTDDEEERESKEAAAQRRIMTEARFALRNQDIDNQTTFSSSKNKRKRRLAPVSSDFDYGDETEDITNDKTLSAGRKLASTMNSIVQKSNTSNEKRQKKMVGGDEVEGGDDDYERLQRGLSMMEEQFGKDSDDDGGNDDAEEEDGFGDEDDDFYQLIKKKSKAKKEAKKQMYAVAPKYPRLEGEVDGERAIGRIIMKNRGIVAHKNKLNRNPRVKKREQYRKALIRRKGAVREIRTEEGHAYGGEATGIKSGISRSRKLAK